jgi:hypothetical protein
MNLPSNFGGQMLLFAGCCGLAYLAWPTVKGMFPDSFPLEQQAGRERFDQYGYTGDPNRMQRWQQGRQGGYSDFFPGPRMPRPDRQQEQEGPAPPCEYAEGPRRGVEEGDFAAPPGTMPGGLNAFGQSERRCYDTVRRRFVDPSFCERADRRRGR